MGKLLLDLQVRKSTADSNGARDFYIDLTNPPSGWTGELRELALKKKQVSLARTFVRSRILTLS
jgi:dipeptidyl-peptidase-3